MYCSPNRWPVCVCVWSLTSLSRIKEQGEIKQTDESPLPRYDTVIQCTNVYRRNNSGGPHSARFEDRILCSCSCLQCNTEISSTKYEMFLKITDISNCYLVPSGANYKPAAGGVLQLCDVGPKLWKECRLAWIMWYCWKNTKQTWLYRYYGPGRSFQKCVVLTAKHILDKILKGMKVLKGELLMEKLDLVHFWLVSE